jgi:DNA processing protein
MISDLSRLLGYIASQLVTEQPSSGTTKDSSKLNKVNAELLAQIGYGPTSVDTLVERSGLTIDKVSSMLLLLELDELIQSAPGGHYVRI